MIGTNTVGKVIIQKLSTITQLEKSGNNIIIPMQISNIQMINIYNQHPNLREEVNKRIEEKFKLNYMVDTFVHQNLGVHVINKTDELMKLSSRKNDVDTILNREIELETTENSVSFVVKLGEFYDDLASGKSPLFLDRLIKDLCQDKNVIYEFLKDPEVYKEKIILKINTDYWQVASMRMKNAFVGRVGEILANLMKSQKLDKEILVEIFKSVVVKILKLKEYDEHYVRDFFRADKNFEVLKLVRDHTEKHFIFNSSICEYLPIYRELLFVINKEKGTAYKGLSHCVEFQYFTMVMVDTLIREHINKATSLSGDDRGGYSAIINNIFFEGIRDIKHPGRMHIIKFVVQIFDSIDYDFIHYSLTDMQTIVQKFHGVNLVELNANKHLIKKLREDRDRLREELVIVNKYISIFFELDAILKESSRFMRNFSDSNKNSNVSLRYILNGLKEKGVTFKLNDLDEIIAFVERYLNSKYIDNMTKLINSTKSLAIKNTKEWAELKDITDVKSFNTIVNKLVQDPIDYIIKKTTSISTDKIVNFVELLRDLRDYFVKDYESGAKSNFDYSKNNANQIVIKLNGKMEKELTGLVMKLSYYFEYFDICDIRIGRNIDILNGYRAEDGSFLIGFITLFYNMFDTKHKTLIDRIKRIRNSTGYKSKINIDNFYTLVKRIIYFYKTNHSTKFPLSNEPLLLPSLDIPPSHIEYISSKLEAVEAGSVEKYFDNNLEDKEPDVLTELMLKFFELHKENIPDIDKKNILMSIDLYYQSKKEELIEKQNLLKDNEFKIPDRLINPNEGLIQEIK